MTFHEWYEQQRDADLLESFLSEHDWTMAGIQMGQNPDFAAPVIDGVQKAFNQIDSIIGMQKFAKALPKAALTQVMFIVSVLAFVRRPNDLAALTEVIKRMSEAAKMGVYSGATVPLGAIIGNAIAPGTGGVIGGIIAKAISYGYFYMGQWADINANNPKYAEWAKKVHDMMPKSMTQKPEPKKPGESWFGRWINRNKPQTPVS
jgi:hypothetical protein